MALLSVYFNAGIWIVLAFVTIGFLVCNLQHEANIRSAESFIPQTSGYLEDRELSVLQKKVTVASNHEMSRGLAEPNYFQLYRDDALAAMAGTYSTGFSNKFNAQLDENMQEQHATEIILNTDISRSLLPGIIYVSDDTVMNLNESNGPIFAGKLHTVDEQISQPSHNSDRLQLTKLQIKDLPSELPALFLSDPRISMGASAKLKENNGIIPAPLNNQFVHLVKVLTAKIANYLGLRKTGSGKDTLIVFTTCNHLDMTVLALTHLVHSLDISDLLVVDDFSADGTAEYLRKKGFFVLSKDRPMGLTDSWNKGYEFAVTMGYSYVIFANNDVLVPQGAIHSMRRDLLNEVLVVPLTTLKGAGHNPGQTLVLALEMSADVEDYVSNPNNVQLIQDALTKKVSGVPDGVPAGAKVQKGKENKFGHESIDPSMLSPTNHLLRSVWKSKPRFNGFVFAVNISGIQPASFKYPSTLFDPSGLIIGQEDRLIADMTKLGMMPKISTGAFVYHFKSVTVKMTRNKKNEDSREDLSKYHSSLANKPGMIQGFQSKNIDTSVSYPSFYSKYREIYIDKPFHRLSVYPTLDPFDEGERNSSDHTGKPSKRRNTVIAFAISDAIRYPLAGDIFTATELGNALLSEFQNIKIMYLSKGRDWYSPTKLQEIDVLVTLLDDYDVTKALKSHRSSTLKDGPKPTLVTIAWARNWFHRWLKQPWMGNYDMIFASSAPARNFFAEFGAKYGHAVECIHGCPMERVPVLSCVKSDDIPANTHTLGDASDVNPNVSTLGDLVGVANEKAVSVFKSIFSHSISKELRLSCTLSLPARNKFGDEVSKFLYFEFIHDHKNSKGTIADTLSRTATASSPKLKSKRRVLTTYRSKVRVKVLQIATNIHKFKKNDNAQSKRMMLADNHQILKKTKLVDQKHIHLSRGSIKSVPHESSKNTKASSKNPSNTAVQVWKKDILSHADYAFTGSYYNVHRNIMNFDPKDLLPDYRGVIIGGGWATAPNVSSDFRNIAIGSIPYQDLPQVYRQVKIVVDDANHVTLPWGSVNSRVFDALSSGALVITNGLLGSQETFKGRLPTYTTASELSSLLKYYLSNDDARNNLIQELSQLVREEHSYKKRGEEFADALADLGIQLTKRDLHDKRRTLVRPSVETAIEDEGANSNSVTQNVTNEPTPMRAICIGVRTYESHKAWLEVLLRSLVAQHSKSPLSESLDLQIFVTDTERNTLFLPSNSVSSSRFTFSHALEEIVNRVNKDLNPDRSPQAHVVWDINSPKRTYRNPFYGYDETDNLVDFMASLPQCEWMMMTNGDNSYNSAWFNAVAPLANDETVDLIGWDFITHHKRNGNGQQHIRISMKRGFVDLASILVRTSKITESKGKYLPDAMFTSDLFARDFYILTELLKIIPSKAIRLLHRILLLHQ